MFNCTSLLSNYLFKWNLVISLRGGCKGSHVVHVEGHKQGLDVGVWRWWQVLQAEELLELIKSEKSRWALGHEFPVPLVALAGLKFLHRSEGVSHGCFCPQSRGVNSPARTITLTWCIRRASVTVCAWPGRKYWLNSAHVSLSRPKSNPICSSKSN